MSLRPEWIGPIPEETVRIARMAFSKGNPYMNLRDEFGTFFEDQDFADLFPNWGQPAEVPWRLALVTLVQFAENLTDRQAADAVRGRIDLKYLLGLELSDAGFDFSVLSEFRARLVAGNAVERLLNRVLAQFKLRGLIKERGQQRTDATHIEAAIRVLNRLEVVGETLRAALNSLATIVPDWLKAHLLPEWFERYHKPFADYDLPKDQNERLVLAETIGRDGYYVWRLITQPDAPDWLCQIPAIETLRQVWLQHFYVDQGQVRWRTAGNVPPAARIISSPYDPEARYSTKREIEWIGYKVHLTETCEPDYPLLITHVHTTPATEQDITAVDPIQQDLAEQALLPGRQVLDAAYVSSDVLVSSQKRYGIELFGPVRPDNSWQTQENRGYAIEHFHIDWDTQTVTCPQGHTSVSWLEGIGRRGKPMIGIRFSRQDCRVCPVRSLCTRNASKNPRTLTLQCRDEFEALHAARQRQNTEDFKSQYQVRAGVEGTISQATYTLGMRRSRYKGLSKTHLQHVATASALNLLRVAAWLREEPRARTRVSAFMALAA